MKLVVSKSIIKLFVIFCGFSMFFSQDIFSNLNRKNKSEIRFFKSLNKENNEFKQDMENSIYHNGILSIDQKSHLSNYICSNNYSDNLYRHKNLQIFIKIIIQTLFLNHTDNIKDNSSTFAQNNTISLNDLNDKYYLNKVYYFSDCIFNLNLNVEEIYDFDKELIITDFDFKDIFIFSNFTLIYSFKDNNIETIPINNVYFVSFISINQYILNIFEKKYNNSIHDGKFNHLKFLQNNQSNLSIPNNVCSEITDCFNCTMKIVLNYYHCSWIDGICSTNNMMRVTDSWYDKFNQCTTDLNSLNTMRRYCGEVLDRLLPFEVRLKNVNNQYSDKNLYCRWKGINVDPMRKVYLNITKLNLESDDKYFVEISYYDGTSNFYDFNANYFYITSTTINSLILHYYSPVKNQNLPFSASFEIADYDAVSSNYFNIFIIVGLVILACVILTIFLHRCSKFFSKNQSNQNRQNNIINDNNLPASQRIIHDIFAERDDYQQQIFAREEKRKKKNQEALDRLFTEDIKMEKFENKPEKDFCENCTICMEQFSLDSDVLTLVCRHTFHQECIKNWLSRILLLPKCPNCNYNILNIPEESEDSSSQSSESDSNSQTDNRNRNGNHSMIHNNRTYSRHNNANRSEIIINRSDYLNRSLHQNGRSNGNLLNLNNNNINNAYSITRRNVRDEAFNNLTSISIDNRSINNPNDFPINNNEIRNNNRNRNHRHDTNNYVFTGNSQRERI